MVVNQFVTSALRSSRTYLSALSWKNAKLARISVSSGLSRSPRGAQKGGQPEEKDTTNGCGGISIIPAYRKRQVLALMFSLYRVYYFKWRCLYNSRPAVQGERWKTRRKRRTWARGFEGKYGGGPSERDRQGQAREARQRRMARGPRVWEKVDAVMASSCRQPQASVILNRANSLAGCAPCEGALRPPRRSKILASEGCLARR